MFIRQTKTCSRKTGDAYTTYRLVDTERVGASVKQNTLLNLGAHFDLPKEQWPQLAARIDNILRPSALNLEIKVQDHIEILAQRYAAQLIARRSQNPASEDSANNADVKEAPAEEPKQFEEVDINSLELVRPRTVGVEHAALESLRQLGFEDKLRALGFTQPQIAAALGNVIGRMTAPASELATYTWLQNKTALGELIGYDYEGMDLQQLYRSADRFLKYKDELEAHLFGSAQRLFGFGDTITLYDLTNTYFEGQAKGIKKGKRARSKEKRSDCPLVTLGLVVDVSGFPKRSKVFDGNVSEGSTLETMLKDLKAIPGAVVVMDAGIATEANLVWLRENKYHYVVVSRQRVRQFDMEKSVEVQTAGNTPVYVQRVQEPGDDEVKLYCYSPAKAEKDRAIDTTKADKFEAGLQALADGLGKKGTTKKADTINQRLGRLKEKYARAAQHYTIELTLDEKGTTATSITWSKKPKSGSAATHPGVYCLRTTLTKPDSAELWRIYAMLTNLEAVFRSLKTDLGLRPVHHNNDGRVEGHLFISLLAYYAVHTLRTGLKAAGIDDSWETLRSALSGQVRITTTMQRRDGRAIHVRKASRAEPCQQRIYAALKLPPNPGGIIRTIA
jgi:transposase